jgi:pimeloyl-ACP methyl ester carboxylesterase
VEELDLTLSDGRILHVYDSLPGYDGGDRLAVLWHHGTPNVGTPPRPLFRDSQRLGLRWVSYDRPGYGGSTRRPGRDIASAGQYGAAVADALGIDRFAVVGHSGGGSHALGCAAALGDRVLAVVSGAGLAPREADGLDWYGGMVASGVAALTAAERGLAAKEEFESSGVEYDPEFTERDLAALSGEWSWFNEVVGPAVAGGPGGQVDDDIAYVTPWGVDPARLSAPTLLVHGGRDGIVPAAHSRWLAARIPRAELRVFAEEGHISVLTSSGGVLHWLRSRAERA